MVLTDSSLAPFLPGVILGSGLGHLVWGYRMAGWEDEHGVELLGSRWRLQAKGLYVRPRAENR